MKDKTPVVIIGSGGHAKVVIDIIEHMGIYEIIGVTAKDIQLGSTFFNYPILGTDDILPDLLAKGVRHAVIGVGGFTQNRVRKQIYERLKSMGFQLVTAIHPSAIISPSVKIGEACVIFAGAVINPDAVIGNDVIIATCASVDHETVIEDHVLVSAGVSVGGNDVIEEGALLAIGSVIVSGKRVGRYSLVAAGAVVVKDVAEETAVAGIPARLFETQK